MPDANPLVQGLMQASKLDINQAKTAVYWRLGSVWTSKLQFYPQLNLIGPSGSGKSTIQRGIRDMHPESCYTFSCAGVSPASARDELAKAYNILAVVEEFDQMAREAEASKFFQARCDRATSAVAYKEPTERGGYKAKTVELFGATIIHARNALTDPALVSRSISIHTRHHEGPFPEFNGLPEVFRDVVNSANWEITATGVTANGRLYDTWYPVLRVAAALEDQEWLDWAGSQIRLLQTRLEEAAGYDHRQAILARIVEVLADREEETNRIAPVWDRISVDAEIGQPLRKSSLPDLNPWECADTVKGLGFNTSRKGGKLWMHPKPVTVLLACQENNYQDEWLDTLREQINLQFGD